MPNAVKYKTGNLTGSIEKSNVALGTNITGPTSTTGWYSGLTPDSNRYVVYKTDISNTPRIFYPADDNELIRLARQEGATGANTGSAAAVLSWMATQTNLMAINKAYPNIVTDGLVYLVDSSFTPSYPTTGTTVYSIEDLGGVGNGTLQNGVGWNPSVTGSFIFDGSDDQISINSSDNFQNINWSAGITIMVVYKIDAVTDFNSQFRAFLGVTGGNRSFNFYLYGPNTPATQLYYHFSANYGGGLSNLLTITTEDYHLGAITVSPSSATYYHDGVASGTQSPGTPAYYTAGGTQYLGRADNMWKGNIAKWMIYNKALTQAEILQNYYQGDIITSNLSLAIDAGNILDTSTSTTIKDISGNGNTFNYEDTVSRPIDYGGVLRLSAGRIYRDSLGWYGNYTISFWVKMVGGIQTGYFYTESNRGPSGCARIYSTMNGDGSFTYQVWDNSSYSALGQGTRYCSTTTNVQDGNWHQITCIWSNGSSNRTRGVYVYCDGNQEGYMDMIGNDGSYASMHLGGAFGCLGTYSFNCYLGPILQYNGVALTDAQVKQNYNAHAGRFR